ncbi:HAD hydrolase-like protein [Variovorax sp. Varisp41]|uniref:HAD hydrolase-like protein n=1 Tax=Variovorax sp. Varisp41 TaxID=3243033 RepID=UPI0039B4AB1B
MWKLFIFDLDNTLVHSDHLEKFRGRENLHDNSKEYKKTLLSALEDDLEILIDEESISNLQEEFPDAEFAVFTTAPRFYAKTILDFAYPNIKWTKIVGFEDVRQTKPDPQGIHDIMESVELDRTDGEYIAMIGDGEKDIKAAYQAGVWAVLFTNGWPRNWNPSHWAAKNQMPDLEAKDPKKLLEVLKNPEDHLWNLEAHINQEEDSPNTELDKIHKVWKFCNLEGSEGRCVVYVCGRIFTKYEIFDDRRYWHPLTEVIDNLKEQVEFPDEVVAATVVAIKEAFVQNNNNALILFTPRAPSVVVTCIPRKPGRPRRMEGFLDQLREAHSDKPLLKRANVSFAPDCFLFSAGVQSHHGDHLKLAARFKNVRDHLELTDSESIDGKHVILLDDVLTTGATIYFAQKLLMEAGALSVTSIAFAQAISP